VNSKEITQNGIKFNPSIPKVNNLNQNKNKLVKDNPKIQIERERNNYSLKKEVICRLITPSFYAFVLLLSIIIGTVIISWKMDYAQITDFWKIIVPVITTYLGYAIGKSDRSGNQEEK